MLLHTKRARYQYTGTLAQRDPSILVIVHELHQIFLHDPLIYEQRRVRGMPISMLSSRFLASSQHGQRWNLGEVTVMVI